MKVDILIVGFQKCGTSALHNFLSNHPKIISSNPKESHFFSYDYRYQKGNEYYHSFFKNLSLKKDEGVKFLEASPSYIESKYYKKALKRIKEYNPDVKVICLVRNPIERAYSAWIMFNKFYSKNPDWYIENQIKLNGFLPKMKRRTEDEIKDFDLFITSEYNIYNENIELEAPILHKGLYFDGIDYYKKNLDNFLLIKNEDLLLNTDVYLEIIINYLELDTYDWSKFRDKKYFSNEYQIKMKETTKNFLLSFYKEDIEKMKKYDINLI